MNPNSSSFFIFNPYNIILFASVFSGLIVTVLLKKKRTVCTYFLALFYAIIALFFIQTYIIDNGLLNNMKWFYGWPLAFYSLIPFVIYAYFDTYINQKIIWKSIYAILLFPFILSLLDVIFFYSSSKKVTEQIILDAILHPQERFKASYGILTLLEHSMLNYVFNIVSLFSIYPTVKKKFTFSYEQNENKETSNKWIFLIWILLLLFSSLLLFWSFNLQYFKVTPFFKNNYNFLRIIFSIISLLIVITPIYFPKILYGMPNPLKLITTKKNKQYTVDNTDSLKYNLDVEAIKSKLILLELEEKFIVPEFDLTYLAKELDIPIHQLSHFFNQYYGVSFSDYRNRLRMEYAIQLLKSNFTKDKTVEALSLQCGFTSRSSFSKSFKEFTGFTVKDYMHNLTN